MQDSTKKSSLTEQYDGWIKKVTRGMFNKFKGFYQYEELLGIAYLASVEAESTYDPKRAKFSAYIKPRIQGAIIRSVSNITNIQHNTLQEVYKFIDDYLEKHNRIPAQHIILAAVGITEQKFIELLDATIKVSQISTDDIPDYEADCVDMDTQAEYHRVAAIVSTLSKQQRDRIADFLDDPDVDTAKIGDIVDSIRDKLHIKENDE